MTEQVREGRRHRRVPVSIRVFARGAESPFAEDVRDISLGGFAVETERPLSPGTRSVFALTLPNHDVPLELSGEVVWSRAGGKHPGMGVKITTEGPARERLHSFVERLIKDAERI